MLKRLIQISLLIALLLLVQCNFLEQQAEQARLSLFIGVDISGSFMKSGYFDDSLEFLARYIYAHLNGLGGLEKPNVLFVGSIGGATKNEAKTFYPIQTFENKTVEEIEAKLQEIFPKSEVNPFTDYNAFFEQVAVTVKNKNLLMRPVSVVMVSDGIPDVKKEGNTDYTSLVLKPMERLARNVTVRLLYTTADVGHSWQTKVRRQRVRLWTQDAKVMIAWKDPGILLPDTALAEQKHFLEWIKDNVDFPVRAHRVN